MWPSSSVSAIYFILVAHLYAVLLITYLGNIGQVFRCAGTDGYLIFFLFQLNLLLLLSFFIVIPAHPLPLEYTHYIILQILCQFSKTLYSSYLAFLHAHNKAGTAFRANHIRHTFPSFFLRKTHQHHASFD